MSSIEAIVDRVEEHRCCRHPVFENWAAVNPEPQVVGALFHQIHGFCAATRPGRNFPLGLSELGLHEPSVLLQEIAENDAAHGRELVTMAGHIVNRAAGTLLIPDLGDLPAVEGALKKCSDRLLSRLPGYDRRSGLTTQARRAIAVFDRRRRHDAESTYRNIGITLALEIIASCHLIPGEKHCLVDSKLYGTTLQDPEMHYLLEHWSEIGSERRHETSAVGAVAEVLKTRNVAAKMLMTEGIDELLAALVSLWDVLDASLLQSGYTAAA